MQKADQGRNSSINLYIMAKINYNISSLCAVAKLALL